MWNISYLLETCGCGLVWERYIFFGNPLEILQPTEELWIFHLLGKVFCLLWPVEGFYICGWLRKKWSGTSSFFFRPKKVCGIRVEGLLSRGIFKRSCNWRRPMKAILFIKDLWIVFCMWLSWRCVEGLHSIEGGRRRSIYWKFLNGLLFKRDQ